MKTIKGATKQSIIINGLWFEPNSYVEVTVNDEDVENYRELFNGFTVVGECIGATLADENVPDEEVVNVAPKRGRKPKRTATENA